MKKISKKQWWNKLDKTWKVEFIRNLLDSPKYMDRNLALTDIYELLVLISTEKYTSSTVQKYTILLK